MGWLVRFVVVTLFACCLSLTCRAQSNAWDIAVLDHILSNVAPGQTVAPVGDMFLPVSYLQAWRNRLARGPQPLLAFQGPTIPTWTGGNVYYTFSNNVSAVHQTYFIDGMNEWAMFANLHFIPRTTQSNYVTIVDGGTFQEGGNSTVGMVGGQQFTYIGSTSWNRPTICHEIGHTLGLVHEHQRSDRNSYVTILTNNIAPGQEGNFVLLTNSVNETAYDFLSIMHYSRNEDSITNSLDTIEPLPAYSQYINIMGVQFDPVLSASDRAGMALAYGSPATPVTNVVLNTQDSGYGSLRAAMYYAFDHPGTTIKFNIPTTDPGFSNGVFTIQPAFSFPSLVNQMTIDGTTEPTNSNPNGPSIEVYGGLENLGGLSLDGFQMRGTNCAIKGLVIDGFGGADGLNGFGIDIEGSNTIGNTVSGCYVGVGPTGTLVVTNQNVGIYIGASAMSNTIGGTTTGARNVISGNTHQGIFMTGTVFNVVEGNYIGLNAAGTSTVGNGFAGIEISFASRSNIVGGTSSAARNVISGNDAQGVFIAGNNTALNIVEGNYLGLDATGDAAVPNGFAGVEINAAQSNLVGGLTPGSGNVLSGNQSQGVAIDSPGAVGNVVEGNLMGTDPLGITSIGNNLAGVEVFGGAASNTIGGTTAAARNVISGNGRQGVAIDGLGSVGNVIEGNYIGVNVGGAASLPNTWSGVEIFSEACSNVVGGTASGAGNLISGNGQDGARTEDPGTVGNIIEGNLIGVGPTGESAIPNTWAGIRIWGGAQFTQIGGTAAGAGNLISGNLNQGIAIQDPGTSLNLAQGNFVGVDITGTAAIPNGYSGVEIFDGCASNTIGGGVGARNILSGNSNYGIYVHDTNTDANAIQGNTIGLDATGTKSIPNQFDGVSILNAASANQIGGITFGSANLIASNNGYGVEIDDVGTTNNSVLGNSIFGNAYEGIALFSGNNSLSAPSLTVATVGTNTTISGALASSSNTTFRIEFFSNPAGTVDVQGQTFLGAINVMTGNGGTVTFNAGLTPTVSAGELIAATATDPRGNTSPFSPAVSATAISSVGDNIPDLWRKTYFGGTGMTTNGQTCASCDPDGDGFTNLQEFYSGTDPTKTSSELRVTAVQESGSGVMISFTTVAGKIYRVEMKSDMMLPAWTLLADQIVGPGGTFQITDPSALSQSKRFYRVDVLH
ncbi:MAG TPA: M12 family metallopeptidase [Verrucomicrobiae bacterium]|nr:M12 family metallopeptidase [Verrucomicrobiae bacterium]